MEAGDGLQIRLVHESDYDFALMHRHYVDSNGLKRNGRTFLRL